MVAAQHSNVLNLGARARQAITDSSGGRVLAVMSKAVYLDSDAGELVWLTTSDAPMHGRGVSLFGDLPRARVAAGYSVRGDQLVLEGGSVLAWGRARTWYPPSLVDGPRQNPGDFAVYLRGVRSFVDGLAEPRGLGVMLGPILRWPAGWPLDCAAFGNAPFLRCALGAISEVLEACRAYEPLRILNAAEGLIGLGQGLTPSGDDFVGGMLFGLAAFPGACGLPSVPSDVLQRFLDQARRRTHRISHSLLCDYAAGQGPESLHRYVRALLAGEAVGTIRRLASDVVRIGHSTGWDSLTGLWAALAALPLDAVPMMTRCSDGPDRGRRGNVDP